MSINPEMLIVARESRSFTQSLLAQKVGVTQSKISKYEIGSLEVSSTDLAKISNILDYPAEFFSLKDPIYGLSHYFYYRKRANLSVSEQKAIEAQANVLRIRIARLLRGVEIDSPNYFPTLELDVVTGGPEEVARRLRSLWSLPSGPIRNVIATIESAGGIVLYRPFGTKRLDAVIQCPSGLPPLFFINSSMGSPGERQRYSLAHEIGHVVMRNFLSRDPEEEANRFASEFLMPEKEIARDLDDLSWAKALRLKPYWKVSAQAIIRRAFQLGKINERKYRSFFTELSARGFRTNEPNQLPIEASSLISDIVDSHVNQMNLDDSKMCKLLVSNSNDYRSQFRLISPGHGGFGIVG